MRVPLILVLGHDDFSAPDGRVEQELRNRCTLIDQARLRYIRVLRFRATPSGPLSHVLVGEG